MLTTETVPKFLTPGERIHVGPVSHFIASKAFEPYLGKKPGKLPVNGHGEFFRRDILENETLLEEDVPAQCLQRHEVNPEEWKSTEYMFDRQVLVELGNNPTTNLCGLHSALLAQCSLDESDSRRFRSLRAFINDGFACYIVHVKWFEGRCALYKKLPHLVVSSEEIKDIDILAPA